MLPINAVYAKANEAVKHDYDLSRERIRTIADEADSAGKYSDFFKRTGKWLLDMMAHCLEIQSDDYFDSKSYEELADKNRTLYEDVLPENYGRSYVNPTFAVSEFGLDIGQVVSSAAFVLRTYVGLCYEQRFSDMYRLNGLFIRLYDVLVSQECEELDILKTGVRDSLLVDIDQAVLNNWMRSLSPAFNTYNSIATEYDLSDKRYLFRYGVYVGDNEKVSAQFMDTLSEDKIQLMADTVTEAYFRGFKNKSIDLGPKESSLVTYQVGWERLIRKVYENLGAKGIKPIVQYVLKGEMRPRLYNTKANKQMEYDHRFSDAVYFDDVYANALKSANARALEILKEEASVYAGLALVEAFGDVSFSPENFDANMVYDEATRKRMTAYRSDVTQTYRKYVKGDAYSFTINAYPLPSIGKDYEAIFEEVIKVNTLDSDLYEKIQQKMIDALDQSDYVHILGEGDNDTDLKVALYPLQDGSKETKFNNCTADLNVPVGEVFTTPHLEGTNGLLHVKDVFLKGLQYLELKIWFEDGMIVKYDCANFGDDEEANRNYVLESVIHPHTTLPLGEFAIGTNTVAYMMAKKFGINSILPILIGEKTGPHFAIGDTCYSWGEDNCLYNPDGKEIVVKDNAVSLQRKSDLSKAYLNKHTDITIPYDELDSIIGYDNNGGVYKIIEGGRFVLPGTELLNEAFDNLQD